jgi:hypothetical protein
MAGEAQRLAAQPHAEGRADHAAGATTKAAAPPHSERSAAARTGMPNLGELRRVIVDSGPTMGISGASCGQNKTEQNCKTKRLIHFWQLSMRAQANALLAFGAVLASTATAASPPPPSRAPPPLPPLWPGAEQRSALRIDFVAAHAVDSSSFGNSLAAILELPSTHVVVSTTLPVAVTAVVLPVAEGTAAVAALEARLAEQSKQSLESRLGVPLHGLPVTARFTLFSKAPPPPSPPSRLLAPPQPQPMPPAFTPPAPPFAPPAPPCEDAEPRALQETVRALCDVSAAFLRGNGTGVLAQVRAGAGGAVGWRGSGRGGEAGVA